MRNKELYRKWEEATNVYRTKGYIVRQLIAVKKNETIENFILSQDTFYKRTPERDKLYDRMFWRKDNPDGKRMVATVSMRKYVE